MTPNNIEIEGRRPLKVRNSILMKNIARWLSRKNITPNQISLFSIFFSACAAVCFLATSHCPTNLSYLYLVCAAVFIQCRLLCNLFDGMVAVEGGKGTLSGELFNDIPDRIADGLIFVSIGYAITIVPWASSLGWLSAILAILTAYIRTLAASIGAPVSFLGPMAKQHRMAIVTIACLFALVENYFFHQSYALLLALIIIIIGCIITVYRRIIFAYNFLENNK